MSGTSLQAAVSEAQYLHRLQGEPTMTTRRPYILITAAIATVGVLFLAAATVAPSMATDIRAELTPEMIAQHCLANGEGSNVEGTFMTSARVRLKGSVICTKDDMRAPASSFKRGDDEGDEIEDGDDD